MSLDVMARKHEVSKSGICKLLRGFRTARHKTLKKPPSQVVDSKTPDFPYFGCLKGVGLGYRVGREL